MADGDYYNRLGAGEADAVQFTLIEAAPQPLDPQEKMEVIHRPGIDYDASILLGRGGREVSWGGCVKLCDGSGYADPESQAKAFVELLASIKGAVKTVYDPWGFEFESCLIVDVGAELSRPVINAGSDKVEVRRTIRLMKMR